MTIFSRSTRCRHPAARLRLAAPAASPVLLLCLATMLIAAPDADSTGPDSAATPPAVADSSTVATMDTTVSALPDSTKTNDTTDRAADTVAAKKTAASVIDTLPLTKKPPLPAAKPIRPPLPSDSLAADTTSIKNGSYMAVGFGWSLGDFALMQLWEAALPDSLGSFGLNQSSFSIPYDSAADENAPTVDTASLSFSTKEKPAIYTMCFPVTFSLTRIREKDRYSFSASGAWMHKVFAATIAATGDTLARKVDFKETMNIFSVALAGAYGKTIPEEYFSVLDIERTYFTVALQVSPLVAGVVGRTVTAPESRRYSSIADAISSPADRKLYGGAAGARIGLNMLKRMSATGAMEFGAFFHISGYGYFRENGARVQFTDINPASGRKNRNLSWITNGFEISVALLRFRKE